jgi:hypothetical protein
MKDTQIRSVNGEQIQDITAKGLVYLNANGVAEFIDFQRCYENYVRWNTRTDKLEREKEINHMDDAQFKSYIEEIHEWREVAYRSIDGLPWAADPCRGPCIQFHTDPPIRFEFATVDDFTRVQSMIRRFGWRTSDWS